MEIPAPIITYNEIKAQDPISSTTKKNPNSSPRLYLLYGIILLQSLIFLIEIFTDQMVHSMLILADAYHHLFNSFNTILLVVCYKISNQMSVTNTFGWVRAELLGMLTTITFIVALIFSLLIEGALQLLHLHEISGPTNPKILIIFGVWSLVANILYVLVVNGVITDKKYKLTTKKERSFSTAKCQKTQDVEALKAFPRSKITSSHQDLNFDPTLIEEAFRIEFASSPIPPLESSSNCFFHSFIQGILSPCFVIFCSCLITLIQKTEFDSIEMIDPLIGIVTAISLCITFYPQMKNTFLILMQTVPENVNIVQLKKEILEKFHVIQNIHEFHIWLLNGSNIVATCHIVLPPQNTSQYSRLFEEIKYFLQCKYGIRYITIQPEFNDKNDQKENVPPNMLKRHSSCLNQCLVKCPCDVDGICEKCIMKSCCLVDNTDEKEEICQQSSSSEHSFQIDKQSYYP